MIIKKIAKEKYLEYSKYEGSQHIAKEHSIYRIIEVLNKNSANSVLEVGLGIGTIYSSVHEFNSKIKYFGTENNDFCLNELKKNLNSSYEYLNIYPSVKLLPEAEKFDVVVIDGKDETLNNVKRHLKKHSVIIIEGDRSDQEKSMLELFPNSKRVHIITLKRNSRDGYYSSKNYQGGVKIIFVNPSLKQLIYWMKHKVLTNLKYKIRKLKKLNG